MDDSKDVPQWTFSKKIKINYVVHSKVVIFAGIDRQDSLYKTVLDLLIDWAHMQDISSPYIAMM